jgi:hypothetical protein
MSTPQTEPADWTLGQTSAHFESSGRGAETISSGRGDLGGKSYGTYQLSSTQGTLQSFLDNPAYGHYRQAFGKQVAGTSEFDKTWTTLAAQDKSFARQQHQFVKASHFDPVAAELNREGFKLDSRSPAVADMVWSTATQFGPRASELIRQAALDQTDMRLDNPNLSDRLVIQAVQDHKALHNETLFARSPTLQAATLARAANEKAQLLALQAKYPEAYVQYMPSLNTDGSAIPTVAPIPKAPPLLVAAAHHADTLQLSTDQKEQFMRSVQRQGALWVSGEPAGQALATPYQPHSAETQSTSKFGSMPAPKL